MASLTLEGLHKVYPDGTVAVRDLSLEIGDGEMLVLVGPSGCGKTTALRMVAGLEEVTSGVISLDGQVINDLEERERDIAMVFQSYALYPHMTVFDNIAFPLKLARVPRADRATRVAAVAATLQLERYLQQKPAQLSGGQRQRVAMGRAIVREPSVFLMDEPLSNLDSKLRVQMRGEILELQRRLGTTTMYVTHDQFEAMTLGDRVAVLRAAELQQVGAPKDIYEDPANLFVAAFLGNPPMNLLEVELFEADGRVRLRLGAREIEIDDSEHDRQPQIRAYVGRTVVAGVRPESLGIAPAERTERRSLSGILRLGEVLGSDLFGHFSVDGARPLSVAVRSHAHDVEDPAELQDLSGAEIGTIVVGRFPPDVALSVGDPLEVSVKRGSLRFFDPDSGHAV